MCAFQCDSCFHKNVCTDEPNTSALNEECALYANVKNFTDVQQLKAEIIALLQVDFMSIESNSTRLEFIINKLRQLSAV
jgi:hypothetical protein